MFSFMANPCLSKMGFMFSLESLSKEDPILMVELLEDAISSIETNVILNCSKVLRISCKTRRASTLSNFPPV